jgi:hypothetical protein
MARFARRILALVACASLIVAGIASAQVLELPGANAIEIPGAGWVVAGEGASQQDIDDAIAIARSPVMPTEDVQQAVAEGERTQALVDDFESFDDRGAPEVIAGVKRDVARAVAAEWNAQRVGLSQAGVRTLLQDTYSSRIAPEMVREALLSNEVARSLPPEEARYTLLPAQTDVELDAWEGVRVEGDRAAAQLTGRQRYVSANAQTWEQRPMRWRLFLVEEQGVWRVYEWFAQQTDR